MFLVSSLLSVFIFHKDIHLRQLQDYQNILCYLHLYRKIFNEFLLIQIHQDLLHIPHLLF